MLSGESNESGLEQQNVDNKGSTPEPETPLVQDLRPRRFKDYVAIPKANGYQSLHTTLFGMHGLPIEIQIRTAEMEMVANNGIAGHWLYKSNDKSASGSHRRAREWMQGLLELQQSAGNSLEFIENVKIDLFPDEVYIFTPIGEIYELPNGSTPIDFAYAVHTDIGNTCIACRIDRRLAPLSAVLESGQTVEIVTTKGALPNPAWLSFAVTGKARASIRIALKHQHLYESVELGRRLLKRAVQSFDKTLADIDKQALKQLLDQKQLKSLDDLLAEIGLGNQMSNIIARKLIKNPDTVSDIELSYHGPLAITGTEGLVVTYAKCCRPIAGDPIVGHISAGRGIVIHVETCGNMSEIRDKGDEIMTVRWEPGVDQEFAVGELRAALLKAGARLMDEAGQAELIVEARSATLGIDQRTTAFGVPAIPLPIPAVGIVQTPELSILKNQRQDGLSGLALTGRERATGAHVFSFDPVIGKTIKSDWRFLGFPFIRTRDQLPKEMD